MASKITGAAFDIAEHLREAGPAFDPQTAAALVAIDSHELHAAVPCVADDGFELFAERLSLKLRRGAEIARNRTLRGPLSRLCDSFQVRMVGH